MKRIFFLISVTVLMLSIAACGESDNNSSNEDELKTTNSEVTEVIEKAGGSVLTKNIIDGKGLLTWMYREESTNQQDNGWRFLSDIDDQEYVNNPENSVVWDFNRIAEIEPAIIALYNYPVGTDVQLVRENGKIRFYDNIKEDWIDID